MRSGAAFFFEPDVQAELASGRLIDVPLREGPLALELDIVYLRDAYRSTAVRTFFTALEEAADAAWSTLPEAVKRDTN